MNAPAPADKALFAPLPPPPRPPAHSGREGATESGAFVVTWEPRPDPVPLNAPFDVAVAVRAGDASASLPAGVEVRVDAGMPGHGHGMTVRPSTVALGEMIFYYVRALSPCSGGPGPVR